MESICGEYGIDTIDLLKMDIEGAEREVLGYSKGWVERVGVLIIELHERINPGAKQNYLRATRAFDFEWKQGENFFLCRKGYVRSVPETALTVRMEEEEGPG